MTEVVPPILDFEKLFAESPVSPRVVPVTIKPRAAKRAADRCVDGTQSFISALEGLLPAKPSYPTAVGQFPHTPVDKVIVNMMQKCDQYDLIASIEALPEQIRFATLCSGSDLIIPTLAQLFSRFEQASPTGKKCSFRHVLSAEMDQEKQRWILENTRPEFLAATCEDAASECAHNLLNDMIGVVPGCDLLFAGFSCKSLSALNNLRALFANCVAEAIGTTGKSLDAVMTYIRRHMPLWIFFRKCERYQGQEFVRFEEVGGRVRIRDDVRRGGCS